MYWYEKEGGVFSSVISTRVRFARNAEGIPFPHLQTDEQRKAFWKKAPPNPRENFSTKK